MGPEASAGICTGDWRLRRGSDFEKGSGANRYDYDVVQHGPPIGLPHGF
ncbi:MAG: hypothetical protein WAN86_03370 [Hyphomicrobiaceae bacterium]